MSDERDRLGDKLHEAEKAREDQWAREQDRLLIEKMRQRQSAQLHCPQCNAGLVARAEKGFALMGCPSGHGAWLDHDALAHVLQSVK
jgi:hypothetical protein